VIRAIRQQSFTAGAVVFGLWMGGARAAPQRPPQFIGHWHGHSICVPADWNAACRDEEVLYDVVRAPADSARVVMHASRIVNGAIVPMGDLELSFVDSVQSWVGEFANARVHIEWWYKVSGSALTGTLLDLPERLVARHVTATKTSE